MKISEATYTINNNGDLKIPAIELRRMGLQAGMNVRVAFLTEDGEENTFREFLLMKNHLTEIDTEQKLLIPNELLRQAKIAEDADVQLYVVDGAILICQEPNLNLRELRDVIRTLSLATCLADELPDDLIAARKQLEQALYNFADEEMSSNEYNAEHCNSGE